jgi:hypothetical protein
MEERCYRGDSESCLFKTDRKCEVQNDIPPNGTRPIEMTDFYK